MTWGGGEWEVAEILPAEVPAGLERLLVLVREYRSQLEASVGRVAAGRDPVLGDLERSVAGCFARLPPGRIVLERIGGSA